MKADREKTHWHALRMEELLERIASSKDGLTGDQARLRLHEAGPNVLQAEESSSPARLLLRQVHSPLIYLLLAAAAVSFIAGKTIDAAVIVGVVVLNTILGFVQEWRAEGALAALQKMSAPHARVLRDGQEQDLEAREVVPGDVLVLETGDRVAADARLLSGDDLRVDESALTGESEPAEKSVETTEPEAPLGDRRNMVWMSTSLTAGRGRALVVTTGMRTEMGRIAGEVRATGREHTPLQKRMHKLGIILGGLGIVLAGVVFGLGVLQGHETLDMLLFAVAVAVSAIPEGLPAVITVTLALGVRRMAARHAIIRRLPAVETLGSTTVICSDKTGTITANQMTVRQLWAGGQTFQASGEGYQPEGELQAEAGEPLKEMPAALARLIRIGALANNAEIREAENGWRAEGSPSEAALLVVARKAAMEPDVMREKCARIAEIPFSSDRKYMAVLSCEGEQGREALVKGAPDRILDFCSHILREGERVELDDPQRRAIQEVTDQFAGEAMRVMAGAYRAFPSDKAGLEESDVEEGLTFAGLWGMIDPPRQESARAVAAARGAGIRPVLITGDYAATALAIARQVGITENGEALTAADVEGMDERALAQATLESGVFARVSPAHKLKIMEALKNQGQVVAMTGDGVNDAPALKGADIGVAMGLSGTEVAREAADMVLTDDNFATIVAAVEEGRTIYANLQNVVFFLLSQNAGEILTLGGALALGLDLPLTAVMILWVNLVTAGACTIPLGVEPNHENVLKEKPRGISDQIINKVVLRRMALLAPLMAIGTLVLFRLTQQAAGLPKAQTVAFTTMVVFEWFQALNARSLRQSVFSIGLLSNRWLLVGLGAAIVLQVTVVQSPLGDWLFGTEPLAARDWLLIVGVASSIWIADECLKRLGFHGRPKHDE
ncbi:MAG: HAD-IC family P-type ATPase [Candidatus Marinimicrobia bacterium]|nr:HAD-IC family P-type ATPase [Candidatus Neomarinimicrobiota bacterium]